MEKISENMILFWFRNDPRTIYIYIYVYLMGSISGWVIPKIKKMVLDTSLHYKVQIKGKLSNPGKGVAPYTLI